MDAPAIVFRGRAANELPSGQPVDQSDRAVVSKLQSPGQFADRHVIASAKPLDGQERLMLLRWNALVPRGIATET